MASMGKVDDYTMKIKVPSHDEMNNLIRAISRAIHLKMKNDIARMEPKNAMENLQRSLYKN